jgi:hypothetical protein
VIHHEADLMLAAGAALDDLAPDERQAYDAHREGCPACAVAADELELVLADLALVVPERTPPADLFAGIRLAIAAERPRPQTHVAPSSVGALSVRPAAVGAASPAPISLDTERARRRPIVVAVGLAAALALVAVGLGARSVAVQSELDRANAQVSLLRDRVAAEGGAVSAALDPGGVTVALEAEPLAAGAEAAVMFVPGTPHAWIVADGLPATEAGQAYQLWHADAAGVHPLQIVAWDGNGPFVAELGVALAPGDAVMITLEDAGGATGDPGPQVVFGEIGA